ncbi:MAG: hypothetical protein WDA09_09180 [Bacteriovoracaceae bacterium]
MKRNEKVVKSLTYDGLGFSILLENVIFHEIRGEWLPKIDIESLADIVFKLLPSKPSRLTGNEIKFIRTYLGKSKLAFAELFRLSHTAVIDESAVLWGNQGFPVLIEGEAYVYGSAKILAGTSISDRSKVYGNVSLISSELFDNARVCEKFNLKNEKLSDNYFCPGGKTIVSNSHVFLNNYDEDKFNPRKGELIFGIDGYSFSESKNGFEIFLNDVPLDLNGLVLEKKRLQISTENQEIEGFNTVRMVGIDEYGKKIIFNEIQFIVGTGTISINLVNEHSIIDSNLKVSAKYRYNKKEYIGSFEYDQGALTLLNVPQYLVEDSFEVELEGVGKEFYFFERFKSFESIPGEIETILYPAYVNNDLSLGSNLSNWEVSHPELVVSNVVDGKNVVEIRPSTLERVIIAKRFNIPNEKAGLSLDFTTPALSPLIIGEQGRLEVIFISPRDGRVEKRELNISSSTSGLQSIVLSSLNKNEEIVVLIRLDVSDTLDKMNWSAVINELLFPDITLVFKPYHFEVLNKGAKESRELPPTSTLSKDSCENREFDLSGKSGFTVYEDNNFKFFSAGPLGDLTPFIKENRIFGEIEGANIPHTATLSLSLLVIQNGVVVTEQEINECAKSFLFRESPENKLKYKRKTNFLRYLFSLPFEKLTRVDIRPGSKVSLALKATWLSSSDIKVEVLSNETELTVLSAIQVSKKDKWAGTPDTYDDNGYNILRTGGDKWMIPHAALLTESILNNSLGWRINDASKLNGGEFKIHNSHREGLDIDIFNNFNFACYPEESQGDEKALEKKFSESLNRIEKFLINLKSKFGYIDLIYLTRNQEEVVDKEKNALQSFQENMLNRVLKIDVLRGDLLVLKN